MSLLISLERLGVQSQVNKENKPQEPISESEKTALVEAILARQESKKDPYQTICEKLSKKQRIVMMKSLQS